MERPRGQFELGGIRINVLFKQDDFVEVCLSYFWVFRELGKSLFFRLDAKILFVKDCLRFSVLLDGGCLLKSFTHGRWFSETLNISLNGDDWTCFLLIQRIFTRM